MREERKIIDPAKAKPVVLSPKDYKPVSNYKDAFKKSQEEKDKLKQLKKEFNKNSAKKLIETTTACGYKRKVLI